MVRIAGKMNEINTGLMHRRDAGILAENLFGKNEAKQEEFIRRLLDTCDKVQGCDVLLVHSPGGWGCADIEHLIGWEKSILDGVGMTLTQMELKWRLVQYFRSRNSTWSHVVHFPEQMYYYLTGRIYLAKVLAEELRFITGHTEGIKVILLGVSQGAAFNNAVMRLIPELDNMYSIELGIFFTQLRHRIISTRTLAFDNNGRMPDPVVHFSIYKTVKSFILAPFYWIKYRIAGQPVKFTYCINVPGHEYQWKYPTVHRRIIDFLEDNFSKK
jgi:hypothetical protein